MLNLNSNSASAVFQLTGTFSGTVQFEGTANNGASWVAVNAQPTGATTSVTAATAPGAWRAGVSGFSAVRLRVSTYSSGAVGSTITSSVGSPNATGAGGGTGAVGGSGTANTYAIWTDSSDIGNSPTVLAAGVIQNADPVSQPSSLYNCVNSASGTTNGLLVTRDASGNCINLPAAQLTSIVGVVYTGGGSSGTALICKIGSCPITLDNTSVIDDCIVAASSGSEGHDAGPSCPTGVQQLGIAQTVNAGTGTSAIVDVFISDIAPGPVGPQQTLQVNGVTMAGTLDNFNNTTPAAQANFLNCFAQTDNGSPTSNFSLECPLATAAQPGFMQLAGDLNGGTDAAPTVTGVQTIPVTFTSPAANDVICFPTSSTLANCKQGVPIRTVSSNSDPIVATDRVSMVRYTAASGATAVTIAQAGTGGFTNNFTAVLTNAQGSGTVTVTPATSTINGAATLAIIAGNYCFIYSDNSNYFANCGTTSGAGGVTGSGTSNTMTKWTNTTVIGNSSVTDDGSTPTRTPNGSNTATVGNYDEWIIDTAGVTANKLACRSSNNKAITCPTSTTQGVLGVALSTGTSGQTVIICWAAHCTVIPSNNTTAGHWLIPSTTVAGDVDDTGSTVQPTGTQTFLAETSVTAPTQVQTTILSPDTVSAAAGGKPLTLQVNGTSTQIVANLVNGTGLTYAAVNSGNTTTITPTVTAPIRTRGLVFSYGDPGNSSAITAGSTATDYMTVPFACTISAYNILIDAGTVTIKFWKVATGTAIPTSGNSISTSGVAISTGTAIHSTTVTDFTTTAVSANDILAMNVSTVATAKFVSASLECDQ